MQKTIKVKASKRKGKLVKAHTRTQKRLLKDRSVDFNLVRQGLVNAQYKRPIFTKKDVSIYGGSIKNITKNDVGQLKTKVRTQSSKEDYNARGFVGQRNRKPRVKTIKK